MADLAPGYAGVLEALEVKLYGSVPAPKLTAVRTDQNVRLILQAAAPGWSYAIDTSSNMLSWTPVITNRIATVGSTNYTDTNALLQPRRFYRARLAP